MVTTSVGTDRFPYQALEKFPDAVFMTDGNKLYFGTDGDMSLSFDATTSVLAFDGASNAAWAPNTAAGTTTQAVGVNDVPLTHRHVLKVGSDTAETLSLSDGTAGQLVTVTLSDASPLLTLTPATTTGFANVTFSDTLDSVTLQYVNSTAGWIIVGSYLPTNGGIA